MDLIQQQMDRARAFFNARADEDQWDRLDRDALGLVWDAIRAAGIGLGDSVLEPGCGAGRVTRELARAVGPGGLVYALDVSDRMVARSRAFGGDRVIYSRSPAERMPFRDESMDAVLCFNCFHLFACQQLALGEVRRVLKPGGRLVVAHSEPMAKAYQPTAVTASLGRGWRLTPADLGLLLVRRGFHLTKAPRLSDRVLVAALKQART